MKFTFAPSRLSRSTNRAKPPMRGLARSADFVGGVPVMDVMLPSGRILRRIPILQPGGGRDSFMHFPSPALTEREWEDPTEAPHVVVSFDSDDGPCIIGTIPRPQNGALSKTAAQKTAQRDTTRSDTSREGHAINEFRLRANRATLAVNDQGTMMLEPGDSGIVRVRLPGNGVMRVSSEGEATDAVAVAGATETVIKEMMAMINHQSEIITKLLVKLGDNPNTSSAAAAVLSQYRPRILSMTAGRLASKAIMVSAETNVGQVRMAEEA